MKAVNAVAVVVGLFCSPIFGYSKDKGCVDIGGEIPVPFTDMNHAVELADGEIYVLQGKVVVGYSGQAQFIPDYDEHPWLRSQKRLQVGGYRLLWHTSKGKQIDWVNWAGAQIRVVFKAISIIEVSRVSGDSKKYRHAIYLEPRSEPLLH